MFLHEHNLLEKIRIAFLFVIVNFRVEICFWFCLGPPRWLKNPYKKQLIVNWFCAPRSPRWFFAIRSRTDLAPLGESFSLSSTLSESGLDASWIRVGKGNAQLGRGLKREWCKKEGIHILVELKGLIFSRQKRFKIKFVYRCESFWKKWSMQK